VRDGYLVDEQPTVSGWHLRVSQRPRAGDSPRAPRQTVLEMDIELDASQTIRDVRVRGPLVRDAQNRALAQRLQKTADPDSVLAPEPLAVGLVTRDQVLAAVSLPVIRGAQGTASVLGVEQVRRPRVAVSDVPQLLTGDSDYGYLWRVDVLVQAAGRPDVIK